MVEMLETANILRHATAARWSSSTRSAAAPSTYDGLSIAWAVAEHLHDRDRRPQTLFATHYHELTELATERPRVKNFTVAVKEWKDEIVFLRSSSPGGADRRYGIQVARLAGLPPTVIDRAREILANLESLEYDPTGKPRLARGNAPDSGEPAQLTLFAPPEQVVAGVLRSVDANQLTPARGAEPDPQSEVAAGVRVWAGDAFR